MLSEHFDNRSADYYRANYTEPRSRHAYNLVLRREACLRLVPAGRGPVLDLGCGPGAMTLPLLAAGFEVIATDLSMGMVRTAKEHASGQHEQLQAAVADACSLPLGSSSVALVVTTGVLEYVPDLRKALDEIWRVLQPGGAVIATMSLPRRLERLLVGAVSTARGRPRVPQYIYSRFEFDRAIESSGFRIDARECCSFAPFPLDAAWPRSMLLIDRYLGTSLNRSKLACDLAKTYIVRAMRA